MNMFLYELKAYRKSTIIWAISLSLLIIMYMSIFPTFSKDVAEFKKLIEAYPIAVRKAIGISIDSISSLTAYYAFVFGYVLLFGSIQAMNLGTSILSKEVREKTADFLLTKPVTRIQIVTAKLLAVITSLVITNIIYMIVATVMALAVNNNTLGLKQFFMISFTAFFVEIMFVTLGFIVSVIISKIKNVLPISLSIVFGFFIIGMLGSIIGDKAVRYITPFKYFDTAYIIKNSSYEINFLIIEFLFVFVVSLLGYIIFLKKDIHAV